MTTEVPPHMQNEEMKTTNALNNFWKGLKDLRKQWPVIHEVTVVSRQVN